MEGILRPWWLTSNMESDQDDGQAAINHGTWRCSHDPSSDKTRGYSQTSTKACLEVEEVVVARGFCPIDSDCPATEFRRGLNVQTCSASAGPAAA